MKAWHFLTEDRKMRYGDNRQLSPGRVIKVSPDGLSLCEYGLYASINPLDALRNAPGPIVCWVKIGGEILYGDDKLCASERTILWWFDATEVLRKFALLCALDVIDLWEDAPDVVKQYLKMGEEDIRAEVEAKAKAKNRGEVVIEDKIWDSAEDKIAAWGTAWGSVDAAGAIRAAADADVRGAAVWSARRASELMDWESSMDRANRRLARMLREANRGAP